MNINLRSHVISLLTAISYFFLNYIFVLILIVIFGVSTLFIGIDTQSKIWENISVNSILIPIIFLISLSCSAKLVRKIKGYISHEVIIFSILLYLVTIYFSKDQSSFIDGSITLLSYSVITYFLFPNSNQKQNIH
ncbi:hypothetical protein BH11PAT1_BH11PAT1_5560 [soil metagenome]